MKKIFEDIEWLYFGGALFYGSSVYLLYKLDELRAFPTFSIACAALFFSYLAYKYTKEKFRFDLMDKRLEIYENVVKFCSSIQVNGVLYTKDGEDETISKSKIEGLKSAHNSFRGLGYHKYKMLFGPDIDEVMDNLNSCFAQLTTEGYAREDRREFPEEYKEWNREKFKKMRMANKTLSELPDYFKPYLYFGDYRR
jgi:hypothetical protein